MRHFLGGVPNYAATSSFDPLSISWAHAFWASDPSWSNPGDGNSVSSWRNAGSNGTAAAQATGGNRPIYRSSYANLNSQPAVEFVSTDSLNVVTSAISQPNHVYVVLYHGSATGDRSVIDCGTGNRHLLRLRTNSGTLQMFAGISVTPGTAIGTASAQAAALYNGASSTLRVNGQSHTGLSVGGQSLDDMRIGADQAGGTPLIGAIAFLAVKNSALTAGELDDLDAWAQSTYGVPAL